MGSGLKPGALAHAVIGICAILRNTANLISIRVIRTTCITRSEPRPHKTARTRPLMVPCVTE